MQADRIRQANCIIPAVVALCLIAGCRIPGETFGYEPLQLRSAAVIQQVLATEHLDHAGEVQRSLPPQ